MANSRIVVVSPQKYEEWKGIESVPRVLDLLSIGVEKKAICERFVKNGRPLHRMTLYRALAAYQKLQESALGVLPGLSEANP